FVSVVAFTMRGMRPFRGGRLGALPMKPFGTHRFLNVRTYVRHGNKVGIYFLGEWLSSRVNTLIGPILFGLPYRFGKLEYAFPSDSSGRGAQGRVRGASANHEELLAFRFELDTPKRFEACRVGSLDEWLMERY